MDTRELWDSLSLNLLLIAFLTSSSFLSTNWIKSLKLFKLLILLGSVSPFGVPAEFPGSAVLLYWLYCQQILMKNMIRERTHIRPHMRKRPQKLLRLSRFDSMSVLSLLHPLRTSHLSWILWSSPFSDSVRIMVERSTARGESFWKACKEHITKLRSTYG